MAIRVYYPKEGPVAVVDTPEEAAALLRLGTSPASMQLKIEGAIPVSQPEAMKLFSQQINSNARTLLAQLLVHANGVRGDLLSEEVKMAVEKFGGVLGGASKIAKKNRLDFKKIVVSEMRTEGTQRYRWLAPGSLLVKYREEFAPFILRSAVRA
jgi:hypothetical protein